MNKQNKPYTGCLPNFEDQFKTFFKNFLRPTFVEFKTCMHNETALRKWGIGTKSEISWLITDPFPGARGFKQHGMSFDPTFLKTF